MDQSSTLFHSMLKDYFVAEMPSAPHGTDANGMPQPKRRRLRRHPVWMFFKDLEDRVSGVWRSVDEDEKERRNTVQGLT